MKQKLVRWLTPAVFLALLFGFTLANFLTPDRKASEREDRSLQQLPRFSWSSLVSGEYSKQAEVYLNDQFVMRDGLIGIKTEMGYLAGKRDANGVYFAKDGYLIERDTVDSINQKQLQKYVDHLSNFVNAQASGLGDGHVRVMIVPTAAEILKDKLPAFAPEFSQSDLISEIRGRIPGGCLVELENILSAHKDESLYYKTDHHWTTDAAYYGYTAYCQSLGLVAAPKTDYNITQITDGFFGSLYSKARILSIRPDTIKAYFPKEAETYRVDYNQGQKLTDTLYEQSWLSKRDKYSYFFDGNHAVVKATGNVRNGKHLLVVEDSYSRCFAPFLLENYETVTLVDLRYFNSSLKQYIARNQITDVLVLYNAVTFTSNLGTLKIDQ